jgi:adenine-specific DNA-methyltransferase
MAELHELIEKIENPELRAQIAEAAKRALKHKQFGLVFEEHLPECTLLYDIPVRKGIKVSVRNGKANETYTVLKIAEGKALCLPKNSSEAVEFDVADLVTTAELGDPIYPCLQPLGEVCNAPDSGLWHMLIEADNYHALQLLEYLYAGKVDCIYIDPPYNTGARDWKYNNDYVDGADEYRHSKWLSFMKKRLEIAKRLLNPSDSVLIVTIDEKEYLHLGCLLEEMFADARIQMISSIINPTGNSHANEFARTNEYIYMVMLGECKIEKVIATKSVTKDAEVHWEPLKRSDLASKRGTTKGGTMQFYPIYVDLASGRIVHIGQHLSPDDDLNDVPVIDGAIPVFPIRDNGIEMNWGLTGDELKRRLEKGYVRVGKYTPNKPQKYVLSYLTTGTIADIEDGKATVRSIANDGSVKAYYVEEKKSFPTTQWSFSSHDAKNFGTGIIKNILLEREFPYPKSLYAVEDTLNIFLANKRDALVVDFFAGSGTTLHAINLLNKKDGGHRRCIMITNNEVSANEAKKLIANGYGPSDKEWIELGIARYVTWPRTVCSIEGHDVNGNPLKGNYIGSDIPMADGFKANAAFFKLSFLDKTKVSLGMQFKELLSTLWMKASAIGKCPTIDASVPDMLILPNNKMAILNDENQFGEFAEQLTQHPEIDVVYLVTDYESSFVAMTQALEGKKTYQLYRDYLDNFRINAGRNSR